MSRRSLTPFRYPGAKNKLLPTLFPYITNILGDKDVFCDAFVGGGSVALAVAEAYPYIDLILNDKDYNVYCFWKVVSENSAQLSDLLKFVFNTNPTISFFYDLRNYVTDDVVLSAFKAIFFNRTAFSGIYSSGPIGGAQQKSKYTVDCRYNGKKLVEKILYISTLLKNRTTVYHSDINELLPVIKDVPCYLDPPYVGAGKMLYPVCMNADEHTRLRDQLVARSNWVLSYDNDSFVCDLYKNCKIHTVSGTYCIDGVKSNWKTCGELVITPF